MKHLLISGLLWSFATFAQHETLDPIRVTAPKDKDELGNVERRAEGKSKEDKAREDKAKEAIPGKNSVSPNTVQFVESVKQVLSVLGDGKNILVENRHELIRQLEVERVKAARDGRRADAKYLDKEIRKNKKIIHLTKAKKNGRKTRPKTKIIRPIDPDGRKW